MAETGGSVLVALAGQQNAGKSTLFNMLTGLQQHIANYPGVTVDKKSGTYIAHGRTFEVVDLPGAYSLSPYSLEERVARTFLLDEMPDVVVNVLDATNLRRSLPLTFQLLEMGFRVVVALNMMDAAARRGLQIDVAALQRRLCVPVVPVVGRKGQGDAELRDAIARVAATEQVVPATLNYGSLEDDVARFQGALAAEPRLRGLPARWLAVKLLETSDEAEALLSTRLENPHSLLDALFRTRQEFEADSGVATGDHISACRDRKATEILAACVTDTRAGEVPMSEHIDRVLLNRFLAPVFLVATVWAIYQLSIVQGYALTDVTWPLLAGFRDLVAIVLPDAGFLHDPQIRSIGLWAVDSMNTLLNYVPIFLILFGLIAILEDSGYMARIAFILDRVLHRFGLHGQSTLPFILSGVFAGGCAVPGVMATKGIPDARARLATILTAPFMNCLAKIPLYTLLINIWFPETKGLMLFYLSTLTVMVALLVAKLLTSSVLRNEETAPFVMELPSYHLPSPMGVLRRAVGRTWVYVRKVASVVLAVATVIYVLLQFPGVPADRQVAYQAEAEAAIARFYDTLQGNPLRAEVADPTRLMTLVNLQSEHAAQIEAAETPSERQALDGTLKRRHPDLAPFLLGGATAETQEAASALDALATTRADLRRTLRRDRLESSFLGYLGRGLEPVTQFAGFDWKINIALLTSFAARENSVATLGVLFDQDDGQNLSLEQRMGAQQKAEGRAAVSAVALMLFFALYPPCLATVIMVRLQTRSRKWTAFSVIFPTILGLAVASAVHTVGTSLGLSGLQTMSAVYALTAGLLFVVALPKPWLHGHDGPALGEPAK
ncbi:ferrous iron transport protein B [Tropicimonas isoalkanivorans]|uniref:Ferrous iron transport protein B n=1 Tax=Tropicimonas isoalkanivorans TaxID=441112 RepID=A0A1I1PI27_9RHOB|nr:ferrous iron transport protein B [Tropicimonas isoalkanivorans]SFD09491.1 ferrous iron transport protein B [Tropicimonas isoalkanivorans]